MFVCKSGLFEMEENELLFTEICDKLKKHPFESPWKMCFTVSREKNENSACEVQEFNFPELVEVNHNTSSQINEPNDSNSKLVSASTAIDTQFKENNAYTINTIDEVILFCNMLDCKLYGIAKLFDLKDSLLNVQENSTIESIKGIEMLCSICLSQMPKLCSVLSSAFLNDTAVTLFLNAILSFEKPLSFSIASALVNCIVYPQVFETKQNTSRNLLVLVLNFSETYPKAVIDEVIIPCLKKSSLETLQFETLLKMTKNNLPSEYISYCIKNILEQTLPVENVFTLLQNLIERKVHHQQHLHEKLAWTIDNWATSCNKNVKFTKLLISVLTVYGCELGEKQISIYRDVIINNKTIMKKAAENMLKKVKKSI